MVTNFVTSVNEQKTYKKDWVNVRQSTSVRLDFIWNLEPKIPWKGVYSFRVASQVRVTSQIRVKFQIFFLFFFFFDYTSAQWKCWQWETSLLAIHIFPADLTRYNLGQYKMEQLSPIPPKAMMKARRSKKRTILALLKWGGGGGRGGPDIPFILSKIAILDSIKWNNYPPSPQKQWWRREGAKARHFGIIEIGGGGEGWSRCSIYFVQDCRPVYFHLLFHCHYFPYLVLAFVFKFYCNFGNRYFWRCMLEHTKR